MPITKISTLVGAVLLIIGTSIGGGILVLPVSTAASGFWPSSFLLCSTWFMMTLGAMLLLEVNLWLPAGNNLISMVQTYLGNKAKALTWFIYLCLLYSLLSAYIAGGQDLFSGLFKMMNFPISDLGALCIFVGIFGSVVCCGLRSVDFINRIIMCLKLCTFLLLLAVMMPWVKVELLHESHYKPVFSAMTVMVTSFGFAIIIPSLRVYFQDDYRALRKVLLLGCSIPLLFYILWEIIIFGAITREGDYGLIQLASHSQPISALMKSLVNLTQAQWITVAATTFTSICVVTAFLGVSLCLTDFLADGFAIPKKGKWNLLINLITFLPPIGLVLFIPRLFIYGISFAGIFCLILLIILPAAMALSGLRNGKSMQCFPYLNNELVLKIIFALGLLLLVGGVVLNWQDFKI